MGQIVLLSCLEKYNLFKLYFHLNATSDCSSTIWATIRKPIFLEKVYTFVVLEELTNYVDKILAFFDHLYLPFTVPNMTLEVTSKF